MSSRLIIGVAVIAALAAGCATEPTEHPRRAKVADAVRPAPQPVRVLPPVTIAPPAEDANRVLAYFDRVRRMPGAELPRELEAMRTTFVRTQDDADRMRLAMLFALPNSAVSDDTRALELLEPLVKSPTHALHSVAVLLSTYVQEQRRLAQNAQALQKDVQTLQQKLDALRSLERSLSERENALPRRR